MYDVIIIGAGPSGISASLYTKRANLNTIVIYNDKSELKKAQKIENYYGFENGIIGEELYNTGIKQAKNLGIELKKEEVLKIEFVNLGFNVITTENTYTSKSIIISTGNQNNTPAIKGIKEFEGKGISYCAICDGFFYRNKEVAILGNGNYAISEANDLINLAKQVVILTNGKKEPNIEAENVKIISKEIKEVRGQEKVEEIEFLDNSILKIDGIFIAEGVAGTKEFAKKLGLLTNKDKIIVNEKMETNIPGIYACGDCTGGLLQVSKAVYEGTIAGLEVINYLRNKIIDVI